MPSKTYKTIGINVKSHPLGNSDKIITIFSRDFGKIKAVAKGCRKTKSKFGGRGELFCYNHYFLTKGKQLDIINQAETIESFLSLRANYDRIQTALYFLWAIDKTTIEGQANPALFDLLLSCLQALAHRNCEDGSGKMEAGRKGEGNIKTIKQFFQKELLKCEGILPENDISEKTFEAKFFEYVG